MTKFILTMLMAVFLSAGPSGAAVTSSSNKELQATYRDIESTLGIVPTFMKQYPEMGLAGAWEEMKAVQLSKQTLLPGRVKELIGLGVSAQIPCKYCTYFHTEAAKMNGASEGEIKETIAMAASTRHWSTYLNGVSYNMADFQKETDTMINYVKAQKEKSINNQVADNSQSMSSENAPMNDAKSAYADMEKTFGSVPGFMKLFPENSVASAWKMMKTLELNPNTELNAKEKDLIGLAVSAQIPCDYCVYYQTQAAKMDGASTDEIHEALAMASVTRLWSTVLNGNQIDEQRFKKEAGQIFRYVKAQSKRVGMISPR